MALLPLATPALAACSIGLPMGGEAEMTTASIPADKPAAVMGREEWAAAAPALTKALDPGQKALAEWSDKESGLWVAFRPQGEAFVRDEKICRAFILDMRLQGADSTYLGIACRVVAGEWTIRTLKPLSKT